MSIPPMFCAVFFALLGSALAGPIDIESDLKKNVDVGRLQEDLAALDDSLKNTASAEEELELLKTEYAKTVIESSAPLNAPPTIDDEDGNETNENTGEKKNLFEGNMILTNDQLALIETPHKSNRFRRQALKDDESSWGTVNPVTTSTTQLIETRGPTINAAMKFWEKNTCVRFKEVTQNTTEYRLEIRDSGGCSSALGKTNSKTGIQNLDLAEECMRVGVICHEMQHMFGFSHVQTRFDRDQYVDIDFNNLDTGLINQQNFALKRKETWTLHDIPYEFGSNMHYYHKSGAKDKSDPVIHAKPAYMIYQEGMPGRLPTFYDILAVNRHFNCAANCNTSIACNNGGVQDVNNCSKCLCPMGWTGEMCGDRPEHTTINVTTEFTTEEISWVAEDPTPNEYKVKYFLLKAPRGMKVQMTPKVLKSDWDSSCSSNGIEVKFLRDPRPAGLQVCGVTEQYPTITSESNEMLVQAYSLKDTIQFKMEFKAVKSAPTCNTSIACAHGGVQDVNHCDKCICPLRWTGDKCDRIVPFNLKKCKTPLTCANGGVQDLKDCYKCICPVGWFGDKCDRRVIAVENNLNTMTIFMNKTVKYKFEQYMLKAPEGMKVQMTPKILGARSSNTCDLMGIRVKFLKDPRADGLKVCDPLVYHPTITSETNEMLVTAYTRGEEFSAKLQYKAVN